MKMFRREKNSFYSRFTTKNCMVSKSLRQWNLRVKVGRNLEWVRYIPRSTVWNAKDLFSLDGEMNSKKSEAGRDDVTTNLQSADLPQSMESRSFEQTCWFGNLSDELRQTEASFTEELSGFLKEQEAQIELYEKASELEKRGLKYRSFNPYETWASKWIACPVAYLFPKDRREECLGDLYEVNWGMQNNGYSRWFINVINVAQSVVWVCSAIQIKVSDLFTFRVQKSD